MDKEPENKKPSLTTVSDTHIFITFNDGSTFSKELPKVSSSKEAVLGILRSVRAYRAMDLTEVCFDVKRLYNVGHLRHEVAFVLKFLAEIGFIEVDIFTNPEARKKKEKLYRLSSSFNKTRLESAKEGEHE